MSTWGHVSGPDFQSGRKSRQGCFSALRRRERSRRRSEKVNLQRLKPESLFDSYGLPSQPIGLPLCGIPLAERTTTPNTCLQQDRPSREALYVAGGTAECIWAAVERILTRNLEYAT